MKYFVSYSHSTEVPLSSGGVRIKSGNGMAELILDSDITSYSTLQDIVDHLETKHGFDTVVIANYIKLGV